MASDATAPIDLVIPVSNDGHTVRSIFMSVPGQLAAVEWDRLLAFLEVMKPSFVTEPAPSSDAASDTCRACVDSPALQNCSAHLDSHRGASS